MIALAVVALNGSVPWQKSILLHFKFLIIYLHGKGRAQVNEVGIADIWEKSVGKSFGILL